MGGGNERTNIEMTERILALVGKPRSLIRFVADRPGHDRRYSLSTAKIRALGWRPDHDFDQAMADTVRWYVEHQEWWRTIKSGEYAEYYRQQYARRLAADQAQLIGAGLLPLGRGQDS